MQDVQAVAASPSLALNLGSHVNAGGKSKLSTSESLLAAKKY